MVTIQEFRGTRAARRGWGKGRRAVSCDKAPEFRKKLSDVTLKGTKVSISKRVCCECFWCWKEVSFLALPLKLELRVSSRYGDFYC